jgi:non-ribosomal peptide synthetase component F
MNYTDTVVDAFSQQAKKTPQDIALKFCGIEYTYKQLDERSNQLAHYLIFNGITPETLIPICVHTPLDMIIGIWGILKAGGAYVPIDNEFPADRIKFMIGDTEAKVVISDSYSPTFLAAAQGRTIIMADNDWEVIKDSFTGHPNVKITGNNLAYVIYTSGSTGLPKGVLIEHKSLTNFLCASFTRLPYHTCHTYVLGVSIATDTVIPILFGSLLHGGELHLFSKTDYNNVEYLHQYFKTHRIDYLKCAPSHWKSLSLNGVNLLSEKILMFGGEALHTAIISDIMPASSRKCMIVNHYGPTETTVAQLLHVVDDTTTYGNTIPIGKPFSDAEIYILKEDGTKVEDGSEGELYRRSLCCAGIFEQA